MLTITMDYNLTELRDALRREGLYNPSDSTIDLIIKNGTPVKFKKKELIVAPGKIETDVYVIASGIVRVASFDGTKEHTFGFGLSGTFLISPLGFFSGNPAFYYFEACEDCVLLRFSKQKFIDLTKQSHDFACWMLQISIGQFHSAENKASIMHGSAKEKIISFLSNYGKRELTKKNPQYIKQVLRLPAKLLASYLGITPEYFSNIRKQIQKSK